MMATAALDDAGIVKALRDNGIDPASAIATDDDDRHVQDVRDLAVAIGAHLSPLPDDIAPGVIRTLSQPHTYQNDAER